MLNFSRCDRTKKNDIIDLSCKKQLIFLIFIMLLYNCIYFIFHVDNFENGPNIATFMKMFTFKSFVIAGNTSEGLRERIKAYPIDYRGNIGGWIY
jgi:hypothetical protein